MSDRMVKLLATWFYIGNCPGAPGTAASAAAVLLAVICSTHDILYAAAAVTVLILGFLVSGKMEAMMGRKDPGCVVIDEVAGILIAFFMLPLSIPVVLTAFFLFRAFDMFKIFPVNKLEHLDGSVGIMTDDLVAGIYTNIIMHLAIRWSAIF